jgi:hypothetical protein
MFAKYRSSELVNGDDEESLTLVDDNTSDAAVAAAAR